MILWLRGTAVCVYACVSAWLLCAAARVWAGGYTVCGKIECEGDERWIVYAYARYISIEVLVGVWGAAPSRGSRTV